MTSQNPYVTAAGQRNDAFKNKPSELSKACGRSDAEIDALIWHEYSVMRRSMRAISLKLTASGIKISAPNVRSRLVRMEARAAAGAPPISPDAVASAVADASQAPQAVPGSGNNDQFLDDVASCERRVMMLEKLAADAWRAGDSAKFVQLSKEIRTAREELVKLRPPPPPDPNADPTRIAAKDAVLSRFRRLLAQAEEEARNYR